MKRVCIVCAVLIGVLSSCRMLEPPKDYVELEEPYPYDFRAVSADGCYFAARKVKNEGEGTLKFWTETVKNTLTQNKPYRVVKEGAFSTEKELSGKYIIFETELEGVAHTYIVGLVVTENYVYVLEAGGEKQRFDDDVERVLTAFRTLR
ncbi:MAG: hypothetical protein N2234_02920 [Planctomycetota bacterium]|nr:hypothetical protein [Planctomycetota bacterium]